jgi:hypothetical protein
MHWQRPLPAETGRSLNLVVLSSWSITSLTQLNVVYKFGGSSVRDAERMREVADIICSFPDLLPVVVLSAMGKVIATLHAWCPGVRQSR